MINKIYKKITKLFNKNRINDSVFINIEYEDIKRIMENNKNVILLDVRSPQEYREKHLNNSINVPLYNLENEIENNIRNKNSIIIVYCMSGIRSKKACNILIDKGYKYIYNLEGGLEAI